MDRYTLSNVLYNSSFCLSKYSTFLVSIMTESYGCSRVGTSKIIVNGTDYLEGSDGINLVSIEPGDNFDINFHNLYGLDSEVCLFL